MSSAAAKGATRYDRVMNLALERGFYFPSGGPYADAQAGFWEYGPNGVGLKARFVELWRRSLVRRARMMEIDGAQVMPPSVFEASGHLAGFTDPVIQCTRCSATYRADKLLGGGEAVHEGSTPAEIDAAVAARGVACPGCGGALGPSRRFNMMFGLGVGPGAEPAYLRPETCQSIFVDFPRIYKTMRGRLPLGIAQVGKSFRNEIAPRQSLLRLREFYQAEIEVFCNPNRLDDAGHARRSGEKFEVMDGDEKVLPHVFEMSMGIDRSLYTVLEHALREDAENDRTVLSLRPHMAPVQVGVLSLVKKDGLAERAEEIYRSLREEHSAFLDHSGAIGRRYRRLDEAGAPLAVTVDHQTLEDGTVTLRRRDTMAQERVRAEDLAGAIRAEVAFPRA